MVRKIMKIRLGIWLFLSLGMAASLQAKSVLPPHKLNTCVACHGESGQGLNPMWPNIGGQSALYLRKQLEDMKAGKTRPSAVMGAILISLTSEDINALAEYYAAQPTAQGKTPKAYLKRGEALYRGGDFKKEIVACIACHGPGGEGNAQAGFPSMSGQHAEYTVQQLQLFKKGERKNDLNGIMRSISLKMSDDDMKAVAYYVQGLRPILWEKK